MKLGIQDEDCYSISEISDGNYKFVTWQNENTVYCLKRLKYIELTGLKSFKVYSNAQSLVKQVKVLHIVIYNLVPDLIEHNYFL